MPTGTGNPLANTTQPYTNCSGGHDTTTASGTYPAAKPLCSACHTNNTNFLSANPGCYDCHGSSATIGTPTGNVFPNISGSHSKHMAIPALTCGTCHANGGTGNLNHGPRRGVASFVNVSSASSQFHYTATGKGTCSNIVNGCHPGTAEWGVTKLGCGSCHAYAANTWAAASERNSSLNQGKGAHAKHIAYLLTKWGGTLNPATDQFGGTADSWTKVCGVCHTGAVHTMTEPIPGTGRTIAFPVGRDFGPSAPLYNGNPATGSAVNPKSCSNLDCHYRTSPIWSNY